ncbi:MAG TPA: ammonia-forming cytochrome c nitrite reductase [Lentimicrobium sp.]|nr:ammonia-forming cytochrome c nitrite reductase [Lentimicrobium sp.]
MEPVSEITRKKPWLAWLIFLGTVIVVFILGLLASSIIERRSEQKVYFQMVSEIPDWEPRNEVWGQNFPREYESYVNTLDTTFRSKYGGGATRDALNEQPEMVILWAGYAFSREYKQSRGHYYAINDIRETLRTDVPQPATCWTCKSTDVPRLMNTMGVENFYKAKWTDLGHEVVNNIGCQDCHDPKTMNLRITRPALIEAYQRSGKDITKATHQEMRSLVCAQCHVEYYFKGEGKYLTFPWDKGMGAEAMEKYYDSVKHVDFVHALSKAPILKAQHPDYEQYTMGVHFDRGVACADCHMPYRRDGGMKFTDHKIQSPLANISGSCIVCHRDSEEQLRKDVEERQDKVYELRRIAEKNLATLHIEAKTAWDNGATEQEMQPVLQLIRQAQWRWDYVVASNATGFHAPAEALRILGTSIQKSQEGRLMLNSILIAHGVKTPIAMPDLSNREKAQAFIGLDMTSLNQHKDEFIRTVLPEWTKKAAEREGKMIQKQ